MKKLVGLYQFNLLREEEKLSVEAHILECDACFEEIYRLGPFIEIIEEMPEFFLSALQPKESFYMRMIKSLKQSVHTLTHQFNLLLSEIAEWWKKPAIKILVSVTAIAMLLIILLPFGSKRYSDLAIIDDNASYIAFKLRGLVKQFTPTQNLYDQGMEFYQEKNYSKAIDKLSTYVRRKKKNAYGHFYLGVSLLLTDKYKKGIDHLNSASKLCEEQGKEILLEKCNWYLGNAYLKTNNVEKALEEFRNVVAIGGEFKEDAIKQIVRIEEMKRE